MTKSIPAKIAMGAAMLAFCTPLFAQSADWTRQVARAIAARQTYPRIAQENGEQGTVRVKVYIGANGAVEKTELVATSGSEALDREALTLPRRIGTLPAPVDGAATTLVLPLTWKLL